MGALDNVTIGMTAEKTVTVSSAMTVGHFVAGMPEVYATPMNWRSVSPTFST